MLLKKITTFRSLLLSICFLILLPPSQSYAEDFTFNEVGTMSRLKVKIRYEDEAKPHVLNAYDSPSKVVLAEELDMSNLSLDKLPKWLRKFKNLRYLNLSENKLSFRDLFLIERFTKLENLNLSQNPLLNCRYLDCHKSFKYVIEDLKNLRTLNLNNSGIEYGFQIEAISELPNLKYLYLRKNKFKDSLTLNMPPSLEHLDVSFNNINDFLGTHPPSIETLDLSSNNFDDISGYFLLHGENLRNLNISNNNLKKLDLDDFPSSIVSINAENNKIASLEYSQKNKESLEVLKLSGNRNIKISSKMGSEIFELQNLKVLHVDSNIVIPSRLEEKIKLWKNQ